MLSSEGEAGSLTISLILLVVADRFTAQVHLYIIRG